MGLKQKSDKLEGEKKIKDSVSIPATGESFELFRRKKEAYPCRVEVQERRKGAEEAGKRILVPESKVCYIGKGVCTLMSSCKEHILMCRPGQRAH